MKILMVTPFPPLRDGVGRYAEQEVAKLRAEGHEVEVLSPMPSAAHHHVELKGGLRLMRLRGYASRYDKVILQYQPAHYHTQGRGLGRMLTNFGMLLTFRGIDNLTVVCHEVEYPRSSAHLWHPDVLLERIAWRNAKDVILHTRLELEAMRDKLGVEPKNISLRDPGDSVRTTLAETRDEARRKLGIEFDGPLLLCIGFLQHHKGFDRAIKAFAAAGATHARLVVAGSVRMEDPAIREYAEMLKGMADGTPGVEVREGVLSDEEFDRWILASDYVVLPYREIWSSAVMERSKALKRSVIASAVGALPEQARDGDVIVGDDDELRKAFGDVLGVTGSAEISASEPLEYERAVHLVEEVASRHRRDREGPRVDVDPDSHLKKARVRVSHASAVSPIVLPSTRPGIAPFLNFTKRVIRKAIGWYIVPFSEQVRDFNQTVVDAFDATEGEFTRLRTDVANELNTVGEEIGRLRHDIVEFKQTWQNHPRWDSPDIRLITAVVEAEGHKWLQTGAPDDMLPLPQFEPDTQILLDGSGRVFLDVGAHAGKYAIKLASKFDKVIAFEPDPAILPTLRANIDLNQLSNIEVLPYAAWSHPCKLSFESDFGRSHVTEDGDVQIEAVALDDFASGVDLVKIDVEGAEARVLEGMKRILTEDRPRLVIEMHDRIYGPKILEEVGALLESHGYSWSDEADYFDSHYWVCLPS